MKSVFVAAASLSGLFFAQHFPLPIWVWGICCALTLALWVILRKKSAIYILDQPICRLSRLSLYGAVFFAAAARAAFTQLPVAPGEISNYSGKKSIHFNAWVSAPPKKNRNSIYLKLKLETLQNASTDPNLGSVEVVTYARKNFDFRYGTRIHVVGDPVLPPDGESFSYRDYLQRDGISVMLYNPEIDILPGNSGMLILKKIYQLREILVERVTELFPRYENALMAGIMLGDESRIPAYIERDFQKTGTAHIIAISGANFALLTWLLTSILCRLLPFWWTPFCMIPFIAFYTILVGGNPAVIRSAIMCTLTITGMSVGRTKNGIPSLLISAALMCLVNPLMLFDVGFQLSAAATLGILLFCDPLRKFTGFLLNKISRLTPPQRLRLLDWISDLLLISISAQIFTVWISASAFNQISVISLFANLLIAPFQSWIMLGGFLALMVSYIFMPFGIAAAWLVWPAAALTIRIVQACALLPGASSYVKLSSANAWIIIFLIITIWYSRNRLFSHFRKKLPVYVLGLGLMLTLFIWNSVLLRADKRVKIKYDTTRKSAVLSVQTPQYRRFITANGLTNFAAGDLFETDALTAIPIAAAAIDFSEQWMNDEFLRSDVWKRTPRVFAGSIPQNLILQADELTLTESASFAKKQAWLVNYKGQKFLFPMGVPPERIFSQHADAFESLTIIILGKQDKDEDWLAFRANVLCPGRFCRHFPELFDCSPFSSLEIASDGQKLWFTTN